MRSGERDIRRIEEAFGVAHARQRIPDAGSSFDATVMQHVRRIAAACPAGLHESFRYDSTLWRFAASTCLVALLLVAYAVFTGLGTENEMTMAFLDNATDIIVVQSFGIL